MNISIIPTTKSMDCLLIGKILYFMWFIVSITVIYNQVKTNTREMYFETKKEILCAYDQYITDQQTITICNNSSVLYNTYHNDNNTKYNSRHIDMMVYII